MILLKYKCRCMGAEREISVPARPENGDLILWLEHVVGGTILVYHRAEKPNCQAVEMEYVKIPVDEDAEGLGMKPHMSS